MIVGIGTDIVQINRIEKLYNEYGKIFLLKNFHPDEIKIFNNLNENHKINYLAKRFAGKESISKALGEGIGKNLSFKNIAILNRDNGAPYVNIDLNSEELCKNYKIDISLSDDYPIAIAFVVISR